MKTNKIIEALENLQVGDIIQIEKREGYIDVKRTSGWRPAPRPSDVMCAKCGGSRVLPTGKVKYSNPEHVEYKCKDCNYSFYVVSGVHSNINVHGVDLSILNEEDWFYVETSYKYLFKGDMFNENRRNLTYAHHRGSLITIGIALCDKDDITLLSKATPDDLAPFFEKYPMYAPVSVGDLGIFYDDLDHAFSNITEDKFYIKSLTKITENETRNFSCVFSRWKNFFKVHESETLAEIKERFLREVEK